MAINKGTLTFDKEPTGTITTVQVGDGATLDIGDKHCIQSRKLMAKVLFLPIIQLWPLPTDKDTYGKIKANYIKNSENGTNLNMTLNGAMHKGETTTLKLFTVLIPLKQRLKAAVLTWSQNPVTSLLTMATDI